MVVRQTASLKLNKLRLGAIEKQNNRNPEQSPINCSLSRNKNIEWRNGWQNGRTDSSRNAAAQRGRRGRAESAEKRTEPNRLNELREKRRKLPKKVLHLINFYE